MQPDDLNRERLDRLTRNSRRLHQDLPSAAWRGRRCFVLAGGLSLKGFDFSRLEGELVIACNRSMESAPFAAVMIGIDCRLWGWYEDLKLQPDPEAARRAFETFPGTKAWLNCQEFPYPEDIRVIDVRYGLDGNWDGDHLEQGLPNCSNTGLAAICLASALGADPIYLLGFDMEGQNGKTAHHYGDYPEENTDKVYRENFLPGFELLGRDMIRAGRRIVNLNPNSQLRLFEFGSIDDIKPFRKPRVVSFFTAGTSYEAEAQRLRASLARFGLKYHIEARAGRGSWRANVHDRIAFLREMLDRFPGEDIVWMDADAVVHSYPGIFDDLDADFACAVVDWEKYRRAPAKTEMLGGTMFFRNNRMARALLEAWQAEDAAQEHPLSQWSLPRAIARISGLKVERLPDTYCQIFDLMAEAGNPVIEHLQASRRLKHEVAA